MFAVLLSVLLLLHSVVPISDRVEFRRLDRTLNPVGTATTNERVDPWVQPRETGQAVVNDIRAPAFDQAWAPDGNPDAVLPVSPVSQGSLPGDSFNPTVGEPHHPRLTRNFDAQGPPKHV